MKFQGYQEDAKDIKCTLQRWKKHETMFPKVDFLVKHILGIVGTSQIETKDCFPCWNFHEFEEMSFIIIKTLKN